MNLRGFYVIALVAIAIQLALAAWGFAQVGFNGTVPMHWGPDGQVDAYGPAWLSFLVAPAVSAGIAALLGLIPRYEPRRENLQRSAIAYRQLGIAVIGLMTLVQVGVVLASLGNDIPVALLVGAGVGIMFMVIGNRMGTVRPNYMFGVRTPWTLSSDLAWEKTHRLMGRLFFGGGVVLVVLALVGRPEVLLGAILALVGLVLVVGFVYSYRVWKTDPDKRTNGSAA
jgi:immunity protein, SdpI family